ncbi:MAG: hypothetical protein KGL11_10410 [Alphaproteobacteria bacterium]|nr:hypothetical protein [Alphaproteobacteria bacterium]
MLDDKGLAALAAVERRSDGKLPDAACRAARFGGWVQLRRLECVGQAAFFRRMARGQIVAIRARRGDGSFYPALVDDLAFYRREARRWAALARQAGDACGESEIQRMR